MLSFDTPMLNRPAPMALRPPTTTASSSPATIQATNGPPTSTGPIAGTQKNAAPNSKPQKPPQKAPHFPPILHPFSRIVVANDFQMRHRLDRDFLQLLVRVIILLHN